MNSIYQNMLLKRLYHRGFRPFDFSKSTHMFFRCSPTFGLEPFAGRINPTFCRLCMYLLSTGDFIRGTHRPLPSNLFKWDCRMINVYCILFPFVTDIFEYILMKTTLIGSYAGASRNLTLPNLLNASSEWFKGLSLFFRNNHHSQCSPTTQTVIYSNFFTIFINDSTYSWILPPVFQSLPYISKILNVSW